MNTRHPVEPSQGGQKQNEKHSAVPAVGSPPEHAQPEPTLLETIEQIRAAVPGPTVEANSQDWAGMDGTTAYHLIERHADNWADIGLMMGEWLAANRAPPEHADLLREARETLNGLLPVTFYGGASRADEIAHWQREQELGNEQASAVLAAFAALARIDTVLNREPQQ